MERSLEQRYAIKFCVRLGKNATETFQVLQKAFKNDCISRSQSGKWHKAFKEGRKEVADEPRSGRPTTARTDENVDRVLEVLRNDRRLSIQQIADTLHMSTFVVHGIVTEDLQMLTGNESWMFEYDPDSKRQSCAWHTKSSPRPKKARMSKSRIKTMIIVFLDIRGIVYFEFAVLKECRIRKTRGAHISTRTLRRMLECPRLAAVPISRYLWRSAPVDDLPLASLAFSSLRRGSFGGHAADIALRLALHALPHPGHPASSQPVCIACGSSDLLLIHRYCSCSAVRPLIREVFSIIGPPPDLQSWIFAVGLENHAITISSEAKPTIYLFFVDREMRGVAGDQLAIFHEILQRWQRGHVHSSDARRDAFITLKDGVELSQIPARLDVKSKGIATHVYVTYGIKCSLCNRQGHKRANCPRKTGLQKRHLLLPVDAPLVPTAVPSKPPPKSNAPPLPVAALPLAVSVVADPPPSVTEKTEEAVGLSTPPSKKQDKPKASETSQERRTMAEIQMGILLKNDKASKIIDSVQNLGLERDHLLQALTHNGKMDRQLAQSNAEQKVAIDTLATALMALTGNTNDTLYNKLSRARNSARQLK
ncbi:hypothetical protein LAZ67_16002050 [Cordylochernes scorpioides]|uniref:Mos1 transposase HTH domain-containing protein n=1 Tax=Cordylochernes scorpioides TaxID=51811 RepID=A0ABY6LBN1_9ARAC|nr:hypothetical protein LAZ67_16002050 [Cordylochernes scorpioides]